MAGASALGFPRASVCPAFKHCQTGETVTMSFPRVLAESPGKEPCSLGSPLQACLPSFPFPAGNPACSADRSVNCRKGPKSPLSPSSPNPACSSCGLEVPRCFLRPRGRAALWTTFPSVSLESGGSRTASPTAERDSIGWQGRVPDGGLGPRRVPQALARTTTRLVPALLLGEFIHAQFTSSLYLSYSPVCRLWDRLGLSCAFKCWLKVYKMKYPHAFVLVGTWQPSQ